MAVPCYLVRHSRIPPWISKILFVLGSYEILAMLEDKIRKGSFNLEKNSVQFVSYLDHCSGQLSSRKTMKIFKTDLF